MEKNYLLKIEFNLKDSRSTDYTKACKVMSLPCEAITMIANLYQCDIKQDAIHYYPDHDREAYEAQGIDCVGVCIKLSKELKKLTSVVYLRQMFEASCRMSESVINMLKIEIHENVSSVTPHVLDRDLVKEKGLNMSR